MPFELEYEVPHREHVIFEASGRKSPSVDLQRGQANDQTELQTFGVLHAISVNRALLSRCRK